MVTMNTQTDLELVWGLLGAEPEMGKNLTPLRTVELGQSHKN